MYEFYYDCLLSKFGDRLHLCFTDTDSFICHVESEDLVADLRSISDLPDTWNFDRDHPLFSEANRRTLEKFKSETADVPPTEFCGLRSKNVLARDTRRQSIFSNSQRRSVNLREKNTSATNSISTF